MLINLFFIVLFVAVFLAWKGKRLEALWVAGLDILVVAIYGASLMTTQLGLVL